MYLESLHNVKTKKKTSDKTVEKVITCNRIDRGVESIWNICADWIYILIFIILFSGTAGALSNSSGGNWLQYRNLSIYNSGDVLTDYQVQVNLTGNNFPDGAQYDGADIRFVDGSGSELSYWIESWDNFSRKAKIWVNITNIPAHGNSIIRMYYGNPSATGSSNADATFLLFEDFEGYSGIDDPNFLKVWERFNNQGGSSIENGRLRMWSMWNAGMKTDGQTWITKKNFPKNIRARFELKYNKKEDYLNPRGIAAFLRARHIDQIYEIGLPVISIRCCYGGSTYLRGDSEVKRGEYIYSDSFHTMEVTAYENIMSLYRDNAYIGSISISNYNRDGAFGFYVHGDSNGADDAYFDNVRISKYASPEPTVSIGDETKIPKDFTFAHVTDVHIGYYPLSAQNMESSVTGFTDTLQAIKQINPEFILITGDIVEYDFKDFFVAFKNLLRGINIPVNTTPGNHDRRDQILLGNSLADYNTYINYINNPSSPNNDDYFFTHGVYNFIGLDSGADYSTDINAEKKYYDKTPEADGLSDNQIAMLNSEFNNRAPKIIFMHHPVISSENDSLLLDPSTGSILKGVPPDGAPGGNNGAIAFNRWNFINYTKDNNVQIVLTGHRHSDAIYNIIGNSVDNNSDSRPLFIQTKYGGYRIIEVRDGKVNPYITSSPPTFTRISGSFYMKNYSDIFYRFGIHAYDSQGRHTGMKADCSDFELGVPDSYYTGDYGWYSVTPQVIVGYSDDINIKQIKKFRLFAPGCMKSVSSKATEGLTTATADISEATAYSSSLENVSLNLTIKDQTEASITEINFYNINATEISNATVDVDTGTNYTMYLDFDGDTITDQLINPDSIYITPVHPQGSITIQLYNGAGRINLSTNGGNISTAASFNDLSLPGKPNYEFPYGLISFNISDLSIGQSVNITVPLPGSLPSNASYWNYGWIIDNTSRYWYQVPVNSNDGDNQIMIQLQDGGIGDEDLEANGAILSTGGPGIPLPDEMAKSSATGGGWIYTDAALPGNKANFGFEIKHNEEKSKGNLEFKSKDADIDLKSKSIDWLDISDTTVRFQGTGTINGKGPYKFLVTGTDNGEPGKGIDYFDINIWSNIDTQADLRYHAGDTLAGGNIAIHQKKEP